MKLIPRYFMQYFLLLFAILLTACVPIQPAAVAPTAAPASGDAAATAPGPVAELTGEFELVQLIVDFPTGTWTPAHTHGGSVYHGRLVVQSRPLFAWSDFSTVAMKFSNVAM